MRLISAQGCASLLEAETTGTLHATFKMEAAGFAHVEVLWRFVRSLPLLPALLSNPIYFDPA